MTCQACIKLKVLIREGNATNVVCYVCGKSLKHIKVEDSFTPSVPIYTKKSYTKTVQKYKQKITQKHYDNLYRKYADDWGIDKTLKWLDSKFEIIN